MCMYLCMPMAYIDLCMFVLNFTPSPLAPLPSLTYIILIIPLKSYLKAPLVVASLSLSHTIVSMIALISMTFYFLFYYSSFVIPSLQKHNNLWPHSFSSFYFLIRLDYINFLGNMNYNFLIPNFFYMTSWYLSMWI